MEAVGNIFKCNVCQKIFSRNCDLTRHKKIHLGEKPFACNECGYTSTRNTDLTRHLKTHTIPLVCDTCQKIFTSQQDFNRHLKTHGEENVSECSICQKKFRYKFHLDRHMLSHNNEQKHTCVECGEIFSRSENLKHHQKVMHSMNVVQKRKLESVNSSTKKLKKSNEALGVFSTYELVPTCKSDLNLFLQEMRPRLVEYIQAEIGEKQSIKWYTVVTAYLMRTTPDGGEEMIKPHFRSNCCVELIKDTIEEHIDSAFAKMTTSFEEFTQRGSGWILENIVKMELFSARYQPLASSSYIPLPKKLVAKKTVLNIQNND